MKNIIIDGNNILYRAVARTDSYAKKNHKPNDIVDGIDRTVIRSFFNDLYHISKDYYEHDTTIFIVWDRKLDKTSSNWRNTVIPIYKQNRDSSRESKIRVHDICIHIKKLCDSMGIKTVFPYSSEGDDIVNYLKTYLDGDTMIVSVDQDFLQCIDDTTCVYNPAKRDIITKSNFEEHVPVSLENFVLFKSIKGDTSDNIRGLFRYGEIKAKKLVENWEEDKEKLNQEQLESIQEAVEVIDLNARPLPPIEVKAILMQLKLDSKRAPSHMLNKAYRKYGFSSDTITKWESIFSIQDLGLF